MEQVVQFSEALAATENDTSVQTPAVLDTTADYFEGVADIYRTRPDGDPIPPISKVVSKLVLALAPPPTTIYIRHGYLPLFRPIAFSFPR